jgi:hypothetical protein
MTCTYHMTADLWGLRHLRSKLFTGVFLVLNKFGIKRYPDRVVFYCVRQSTLQFTQKKVAWCQKWLLSVSSHFSG